MAKVAVLLATYNGEKYIREQLESLDNQTLQDFHCYIHDDGSSDRTVEIIKEHIHDNSQYELVDGSPTGSAANNFLFLLNCIRDEDLIMFCDQDDVWKQNKIQDSVELYELQKEIDNLPVVVCTDLTVVSENLEMIAESYFVYENRDSKKTSFNELIKKNVAPGCTMLINRKMAKYLCDYFELTSLVLHDWAIMILASLYGNIYILNESTILYRQHSNNVVGAKNKAGIAGLKKQLMEVFKFEKIKNIKTSVELEKKIINCIIENSDNRLIATSNVLEMAGLFSKSKLKRIKTYLRYNAYLGIRGLIRSAFV